MTNLNTKSTIKSIIKRDGQKVRFDPNKIKTAIKKAFINNGIVNEDLFEKLTTEVILKLEEENKEIQEVEHIQDVVEKVIAQDYYEISRKYASYRDARTAERKKKERMYKKITDIIEATDRENANVGNGPSSKLLQIAEVADKEYAEIFLITDDVRQAVSDNMIHIHDFSWYAVGTTTCTFIPLGKLLTNGFNTGHGFIRPPKGGGIKTAMQLACIIFQASQNDQHGGQAFGWFDRDLAPFVKLEFENQKKALIEELSAFGLEKVDDSKIEEFAWEKTRKAAFQAAESLVHNLNSMHARAGAQVPFTSINIGTDTSKEGRLVAEMVLKAYEKGLGKGEQPLFPNIVFKVKKGVNFEPNTPNHDLLQLALQVLTKRLFPNFVFQDCSINKDFPSDVPTMGCRTRVAWNRNKPMEQQTCEGRGNASFTTVNTVGIALKAKYKMKYTATIEKGFVQLVEKYNINIPSVYKDNNLVKKYFVELNKYIDIVIQQLLDRISYQQLFTKEDFPFLMNGVWMDSGNLKKSETVAELIKNGTLGIGFIGLAETLKCLIGKHHGEDENADKLGEEIVSFMEKKANDAADTNNLNFAVIATPAEGLSEKFVTIDKKNYGIIEGVTDKAWYTNSFHVPVEFTISMFKKLEIEGKYHKYCKGGAISYVELNEAPVDNIEGIYELLKCMDKNDVSYGAINFPVDRCRNCNESGVIETTCPVCSGNDVSRVRRITGYLSELDNFNNAKREEVKHRVSHNTCK